MSRNTKAQRRNRALENRRYQINHQLRKSGFDVNEAVNSVKESMKPHVSVNETHFSLTLEVSAESLPEILTICNKILE